MARKVGYLGPPGTFGEQAALTYDSSAELVPLSTNGAVVVAVASGQVEDGVAPIENSLEGAVNDTVDALVHSEWVFIKREIVVPVEHCLITSPNLSPENIEVVLSHPQALAQCRAYLDAHLPQARLEAALSTAGAVTEAVGRPDAAAIGTRRAAELAGGVVRAASIQDAAMNKTRFVVVSREDGPLTGDDKTSLAFSVAHDRPGTLLGVLREFADRQINLTHIESRPSRQDLGIYVFLIEIQGHRQDQPIAEALAAVKSQASFFRNLGSYPRFREALES